MGILTVLFCIVCAGVTSNRMFSKNDISWMTTVHFHFCKDQTTCLQRQKPAPRNNLSRSLRNTTIIESWDISDMTQVCCEKCSCSISDCVENSNCCPEMLPHAQTVGIHKDVQMKKCILPQLKPFDQKHSNTYTLFKMIMSCSDKISAGERGNLLDMKKCWNGSLYNDIYTKVPVVDISTNTVYLNRYCAYCNGLEHDNFIYWRAEILCTNGNFIPERLETLVEDVILSESCNLIASPPDQREYSSCTYAKISKCNETGKWLTYDPVIELACSAYTAIFQGTYRNVFCYLCNINENIKELPVCPSEPLTQISFSMFLKLESNNDGQGSDIEDMQGGGCSTHQFHDPIQGKCVGLKCKGPKVLIEGDCRHIADNIGGIKYVVFLKLTTVQTISTNNFDDMLMSLAEILTTYFENAYATTYSIDLFYKDLHRDEDDKQNFQKQFDFIVAYSRFYLLPNMLTNISFIDKVISLHETTLFVPFQNHQKRLKFTVELDLFYYKYETNYFNWSAPFTSKGLVDYNDNRSLISVFPVFEDQLMPDEPENVLLPVHDCPLVELNASFYHIIYHPWGIFIKELNTEFRKNEYLTENIESGPEGPIRKETKILICKDKIQPLFKAYAYRHAIKPGVLMFSFLTFSSKTGILSVVSVGISVCCLLASVACTVYARFVTKETEYNHICLAVSLICSQLLFQFGTGQSSHVPQRVCKLIGALIHYSWLVSVLWMNICSFHLYRKLIVKITTAPLQQYRLSSSLYCVLTAFLPVAVNIVISREREDIGYGGVFCFISEFRMTLLCFGLPIFVILVINLILYFVVLTKTNNIQTLSEFQNDRFLLHYYSMLSALTLVTWSFGVLYMDVGFDLLEYIFLLSKSGQGIIILIATLYGNNYHICSLR